ARSDPFGHPAFAGPVALSVVERKIAGAAIMTQLLRQFSNGELVALFAILGGLFLPIVGGITVAITKVVAAHLRRTRLDDMEVRLKMEMIHRDMSADEIAQILEVSMVALPQGRVDMSCKSTRP